MRVAVVVLVVDRGADVVEHAGGPEQLALGVTEVVQASRREAVEHAERQRRHAADVLGLAVEAVGEVLHRLAAHVLEQLVARPAGARRRRPRAGLPRSPRCASKPPLSSAAASTSAPPRITSPRSGLMPLTSPRLEAGLPASSSIRSSRASRVELESLHVSERQLVAAHRGGGEVADRAADADQAAAALPPAEPLELGLDTCLRSAFMALAGAFSPGRNALADADRAERQRLGVDDPPAGEPEDLDAAAADVEAEAVVDRGGVGDREPAVAGLLAAADHARVEPGPLADGGEQVLAVGRVADRAGGDCLDGVDAGRAAEGARRPRRCAGRGRCARDAGRARRPSRRPTRTASRISSTRLHQGVSGS